MNGNKIVIHYLFYTNFETNFARVIQTLSTSSSLSNNKNLDFQIFIPKTIRSVNHVIKKLNNNKLPLNFVYLFPFGRLDIFNPFINNFFAKLYIRNYYKYLLGIYKPDLKIFVYVRSLNTLIPLIELKNKKKLDFKIIYEAHQLFSITHTYYPNISLKKEIYYLNRVNGIIAITKNLETQLLKKINKEIPISVIPDAFELSNFEFWNNKTKFFYLKVSNALNFSNHQIIAYSGSFQKWKGVELLINVFDKLLQNNFKSIKLLLIGNKKSFDNYLKNLDQDTRKNIITIGPVDHFKIPFYLNLADILILPTLNNIHGMYYTSPLKLFEYLATKKTLICSDNPAIKEIVDENIVYFFKSANEDSLYQVLSNLLKTNKKEMKNQIFDLENFSYKIRALKVFNFINDLSNER